MDPVLSPVVSHVGAEGFELDLGPWSCLANRALSQEQYLPDFDAVGIAPLRALRVRRPAFRAALEATSLQPVSHQYQVFVQVRFEKVSEFCTIRR